MTNLRSILSRLRFRKKLEITREGKWFLLLTLILGGGAVNTGRNLLYLIEAMLLSLIIVSGILSDLSIRGISVKRAFPKHIFAGRRTFSKWSVKNLKWRIPAFTMEISEKPGEGIGKTTSALLLKIPPKTTITKKVCYNFKKRGRYRLEGFTVVTGFPFGLFRSKLSKAAGQEVIVYPKVSFVKDYSTRRRMAQGDVPRRKRGSGVQLYNLREYVSGEDSRKIHWKSTAKSSILLSKEFESEEGRKITIVFDNSGSAGNGKVAIQFEERVEYAASLAYTFTRRGYSVGLKTTEGSIPCKEGQPHLYSILKSLATIAPAEMGKIRFRDVRGDYITV